MIVSGKLPKHSSSTLARYPDIEYATRSRARDTGGIYDGTVGWQDGGKHYDSSEAIHLVKVTLFDGFRASAETPPQHDGRAHGHQILCRTSGPMHVIPPDGAQVVVAVPANRMRVPGGGVIIAQPNEARLYADESTFIRTNVEKGIISLFTTDDMTPNGRSVFLQIKPGGLYYNSPMGKLTFDQNGFHLLHRSGARIDLGAISGMPAPLDALGSYVKIGGAMVQIEASAVALGPRGGAAEPVTKATTLTATLGAISSALTALEAYATAAGMPDAQPGPKEAAMLAAQAALTPALAAVAAAVAAAPAAMASQSTMVT
jgi:hypothetical protein